MDFAALLTKAHAAAKEAAAQVHENQNEFDCGFAWVKIDGRSPLAAYCRKMIRQAGARLEGSEKRIAEANAAEEHGSKGYPNGWQWWRPGGDHRQSIRIHEAGANAFRAVLADAGYNAEVYKKRTVIKGSEEHLAIVRGPLIEQVRQKELRIDCMKAEAEEQRAEILKHELREQELEKRAERAEQALKQAQRDAQTYAESSKNEVNGLRSRLFTSELAYAKLRGYLDRMVDEQPPVMVPREREHGHASMPDGTMGTQYSGWRGGDGNASIDRQWFHR